MSRTGRETREQEKTPEGTGLRRLESPGGFRKGRDPRPNDVFIAVMGVTGAGKSSFIKLASGKEDVKIGHSIESCTSTVEVHAYDVTPDRTIYLIDTPGFDDTTRSDTEVLRDIAKWIGESYQHQILLHGIIYLHRVSDPRLQGSAKKNLLIFKKLCGQDALKKVILVTTMWDRVGPGEGEIRERDLIATPEVWGYMMDKGSSHRRHLNTAESARDIILSLANGSPITTSLQKELVDEHRSLDETSAGRELESELRMEKNVLTKKLQETETDMKEAIEQDDRDTEDAMREERDRFARQIEELEQKTDSLRLTLESLLKERDERVASLEQRLDEQQAVQGQSRPEAEEEGKRPATSPPSTGPPRITLLLNQGRFVALSPLWSRTNSTIPLSWDQYSSFKLDRAAIGVHDNDVCFIRRYSSNGQSFWSYTPHLAQAYPRLDVQLKKHNADRLDFCVLGLNQKYYAQWLDGKWSGYAAKAVIRDLDKCHEGDSRVYTIALGRDDAYCISYGAPGDMKALSYKYQLHGQYPSLEKFFQRHKSRQVSILAVTLDTKTATDFIIVYCLDGDDSIIKSEWHVSNTKIQGHVSKWWKKAGEALTPGADASPEQDSDESGIGEPKEKEADKSLAE